MKTKWLSAVTPRSRWLNGKKTKSSLCLGLSIRIRKELLKVSWSRSWRNFKKIRLSSEKCPSYPTITMKHYSKTGLRQTARWAGNISETTATSGSGAWPTLSNSQIQLTSSSPKPISSRCRAKMLNTRTWPPKPCVSKVASQKPSQLSPNPRRRASFLAEMIHTHGQYWGERGTYTLKKTQPWSTFRTKLLVLNLSCDQ